MAEPTPLALVDLLGRRELRIRTGILELPVETIGNESNLAVGLGVGWRDICAWKLSVTPGDRTHLGLSWEMMTQDLVSLLSDLSLPGHCVWVTNLDVLLAAIAFDDRKRFWGFMRISFRQSRGLLLSMPQGASRLLPKDERSLWLEYGRLSTWTNHSSEIRSRTL